MPQGLDPEADAFQRLPPQINVAIVSFPMSFLESPAIAWAMPAGPCSVKSKAGGLCLGVGLVVALSLD